MEEFYVRKMAARGVGQSFDPKALFLASFRVGGAEKEKGEGSPSVLVERQGPFRPKEEVAFPGLVDDEIPFVAAVEPRGNGGSHELAMEVRQRQFAPVFPIESKGSMS